MWNVLVAERERFVSEKVVLQYIGYIKTHLHRLQSGKHSGSARERKIFYHVCYNILSSHDCSVCVGNGRCSISS